MNVLVLSSLYTRPGKMTGAFVHRQVVELARLGIGVRVICHESRFRGRESVWADLRRGAGEVEHVQLDGIRVTYLPYWNASHSLPALLDSALLERAIREELERDRYEFDLIHAHRLYPTGHAALAIARRAGVPLVVSARGSDVHTNPARSAGIARCTRATIRGSDRVLAVSEELATQLVHFARPRRPVQVVYNGVDAEQFRPVEDPIPLRRRLGLPPHGLGVCVVARLVPEKGIAELTAAFQEIATDFPGSWLAAVGDGPCLRTLGEWARASGLQGRVFLPGARPADEVPLWMSAADVFVLPSYREGLPNVVLEAMACGCAVVATAVGGVAEVVTDGVSGLLVPPRAAAPLAAAIQRVLRSDDLRRSLAGNARARVLEHFSWRRSGAELLGTYREVLATTVIHG